MPNGALLTCCSHELALWNQTTGECLQIFKDVAAYIQCVYLHPGGVVYAGTADCTILSFSIRPEFFSRAAFDLDSVRSMI